MIPDRILHHFSRSLLLSFVVVAPPNETNAQSLPSNVIHIVVPAGPGSPPDVINRVIATELAESDGWRGRGECGVLTCSALKRSYRDIIIGDRRDVVLVYLKGSRELIHQRMVARHGHFMPLSLLEAMASGMAVVTTDACGMSDVVEHGYNGLLVKPATTKELVQAVTRLIQDKELRQALGRQATDTARRYTWDLVGARYLSVLELAARSGR